MTMLSERLEDQPSKAGSGLPLGPFLLFLVCAREGQVTGSLNRRANRQTEGDSRRWNDANE